MPPNGTAGLARSAVSGMSRLPSPPARTMAKILGHRGFVGPCDANLGGPAGQRAEGVGFPRLGMTVRARVGPCASTSSARIPAGVYGGAGVHVAELVAGLRERGDIDVQVRCFGAPRDEPGTTAYADLPELAQRQRRAAARSASTSHGRRLRRRRPRALPHLVRQHGRPPRLAAARHPARRDRPLPRADAALEGRAARRRLPRLVAGPSARPTRAAAAVVAVSAGMRDDILQQLPVARPGPSPRRAQRHRLERGRRPLAEATEIVRRHGIDPDQRSVVFVGRITRQKGLPYLLRACRRAAPRRPARALRRRARHPRDPRRGRGTR